MSTIFSFLLAGWVAGPGVGSGSGLFLGKDFEGAGKGICSVGGGRMMRSATAGKAILCSACGGCTMIGSIAVVCEFAVTF